MYPWLLRFLGFCFAWGTLAASTPAVPLPEVKLPDAPPTVERGAPRHVYVIPIREEIGSPILFILRRGLKEAIDHKADAVILDMKTPGGALDTTFEIMEALAKFPGTKITYVNTEAISAGAFISAATDEIWFAPNGIIGAAAPVSAGGQEIDVTMRQKIVAYLKARVRADSEGKGYRGQVVSAMMDADYELKIGDQVIKPKGELLAITASEAAKTYGEPPQTLLSAGTAKDLDDLLAQRFGPTKPTVTRLEVTWSESFAVWLHGISPILLGLGLLALYIEFKTPGFGIFGITGIACLAIVFLGNFVAGLSGHEPMLVFGLGLLMFVVEVFFFPGIFVLALGGIVLMLGSLLWSMADLWPNEPISVVWSAEVLIGPFTTLGLAMLIAVVLAIVLARFIPSGWVWDKLVVQSTVAGAAQTAGGGVAEPQGAAALVGREAVAVTGLFPSGQIEVDGQRYEARVAVGTVARGRAVIITSYSDFGFIVEEKA